MVKRVKRRKLVAAKDMNSGRILKKTDIECKQTDTPEGLESKYINNVIGRKLIKNLKKNNIITFDMLGD
jgi:sialic acid synthase SpsE